METDDDLEYIGDAFSSLRYHDLVAPKQIERLSPVSDDLMKAGLLRSNPAGLYKPSKEGV